MTRFNRLLFLNILLLLVSTKALQTENGICKRCICERILYQSQLTLNIDCSRLHDNDAKDLLGQRTAGSVWKVPAEDYKGENICIKFISDGNSIPQLHPLPPFVFENNGSKSNETMEFSTNQEMNSSESIESTTEYTPTPNSSFVLRLDLSLRDNHIKGIDSGAFASLSDILFAIDLADNELTYEALYGSVFHGKPAENSYEPIPNLERLNLARNKLHSLDAKVFEHVSKSLKILNLQGNPLGKSLDLVTEMALSTLKGLKDLNLADTGLNSYPEGLAHSLQSLENLRLDGNQFQVVPATLSVAKPTLVYLSLNRNPIRTFNASSFAKSPSGTSAWSKLEVLDVAAMHELEAIGKGAFQSLISLRILRCAYNRKLVYFNEEAFRSEGVLEWGRWRGFQLRELNLQGNALEWISPDVVPWVELETVNMQGNPWKCDCSLKPFADSMRLHILKRSPNLLVGLRCAKPPDLKGFSILMTYPEEDASGSSESVSRLIERWSECKKVNHMSSGEAIASALGAVGFMVLLSLALVAFLVTVVKRSMYMQRLNLPGQVRYVKGPPSPAGDEEDEHVIMDMRSAVRVLAGSAESVKKTENVSTVKGKRWSIKEYRWPSR